ISAALKNVIDWVSRPAPNEKPLEGFTDKVVGLMSASSGSLGGLRGLVHVRAILSNINALVIPDQIAIPKADEAFNEDGSLKNPQQQAKAMQIGAKVARLIAKLKCETHGNGVN